MPGRTPLDQALNSRNTFLAFTGIVTAVAAWSIWGSDMFPAQEEPTGDPSKWTEPELRRWLTSVCTFLFLLSLTYFCYYFKFQPRRLIKANAQASIERAKKT